MIKKEAGKKKHHEASYRHLVVLSRESKGRTQCHPSQEIAGLV